MCTEPRDLSATEYEIADKLTGAGWKAHRCMDAWTAFEKDGRQVLINWDSAGEIESVEGIPAAELLGLLTGTPERPAKDTPAYGLWLAAIEVAIHAPWRQNTSTGTASAKIPWGDIHALRRVLDRLGIDWTAAKRKNDARRRDRALQGWQGSGS
jgi:hypothetical protein